jgi:PAS domain S-box-containing protein
MSRTLAFLDGGGEMGERIRNHEWASTPLGALETWSYSLRTVVALMIRTSQPTYLAWGPHQICLYNDAYISIVGSKHPACLGQPAHKLWAEVWETLRPLNEAVLGGESLYFEDMPFAISGRARELSWFSFSYTPLLDDTGEIAGIYCVALETTDKVLTSQEMVASRQALYDLNQSLEQQVAQRTKERDRLWRNTQDIQLVTDGQAVIQATNPAFTTILGWTLEDVIGKSIFEFIIPDDGVSVRAVERLRSQKLLVVENRYRHKDGGFRWLAWVGTPDGEWFYGSGRDITAEKEQADALATAEEALRQAQKMEAVGQLTGGLAHDFNNLLAGISGALELMQFRIRQGRLADVERYISTAQGAVRRAASLTHRLLAFSRRQTLLPSPTDVNRLVQSMEDMIQRTVGPIISVEVVGAAGAWPALVDPSQLENALLNLCINARDAMPEGGRITIETANKWIDANVARQHNLPEGQYVSLCVSDTGTGMTPEVIARVFEPFFTTKPIGEGTGLGLSMVYGFAQQSGGQVRIYSEVGQGSTVCIYLPRHYGDTTDEVPEIKLALLNRVEHAKTVLVVDDEPTVLMLMLELLEDLGYETLEARDSAAGLKILQSDVPIDLLVTDVGLPGGMNGRQMADAARVHRSELKVLFITGYAENAVFSNGILQPGMAVVTKPFSLESMGERVQIMLGDGRKDN